MFLFQISTDTNIQAVKRNCFLVLVIAYIICSHVPESFRWFVGLSQLLVVCILHKEIYKERGIVTARKKFCHDTNQHFILSLSLSLFLSLSLSLSLCLFLWKFEYVLAYMHMYIHYLIHSWLNLVSSIYTGWEVTVAPGPWSLEFRKLFSLSISLSPSLSLYLSLALSHFIRSLSLSLSAILLGHLSHSDVLLLWVVSVMQCASSSQELLGQSLTNWVCSICRVREQEILNFMTHTPRGGNFWVKNVKLMY